MQVQSRFSLYGRVWLAVFLLLFLPFLSFASDGEIAYEGYPFRSNFVTLASGVNVHYLDEGEGDVPLLLIHGIPTQAFLWRQMIPVLAENNRVIAIDQPNWGKSDKTPQVRNGVPCAGDYATWIKEFVDALGLEKVRLVIHDMGFVGFLFAARNPERVEGIALFETAIGPIPRAQAPEFLEVLLGPDGERLLLEDNFFVETLLFNNAFNGGPPLPVRSTFRNLTEEEAEVYRQPFLTPESRRAILFDRECIGFVGALPEDPGTPERKQQNFAEFLEFATYLATTEIPRLVMFGNPGFVLPAVPFAAIVTGQAPPELGGWQSTESVTTYAMNAPSLHYWQDEENGAPQEAAEVIQDWIDTTFPQACEVTRFRGRATRALRPHGNAFVSIPTGRCRLEGELDLSAAEVTIESLLNEPGGVGELLRGDDGEAVFPVSLSVLSGQADRAAFTLPSTSPDDLFISVQMRKRRDGQLAFTLLFYGARIPENARQCESGAATAALATTLTIDDGVHQPVSIATVEDWQCRRNGFRVSRR